MSADAWQECPRCKDKGDLGYRTSEFREDYEIYGAETGAVTVEYRGECQRCGLLLEFKHVRPIPGYEPPTPKANEPEGSELPMKWEQIPAGCFVLAPNGRWYEVMATKLSGRHQHVTLDMGDGKHSTWPRDPKATVTVRRGTVNTAKDAALDMFGQEFMVAIIEDQVS